MLENPADSSRWLVSRQSQRLPAFLAALMFVPATAWSYTILPNLDARISTGPYTVTSISGVVPLITLNYQDAWNAAFFSLDGAGFDAPFSLAGNIAGDEWHVAFTLTGLLDVPDRGPQNQLPIPVIRPQFLSIAFEAQHVASHYVGQPPVGPLLAYSRSIGTGSYQGFVGVDGTLVYYFPVLLGFGTFSPGSIPHGQGRRDEIWPGFFGLGRPLASGNDDELVSWRFSTQMIDTPEPTSIVLLGAGLAIGAYRHRRRVRS